MTGFAELVFPFRAWAYSAALRSWPMLIFVALVIAVWMRARPHPVPPQRVLLRMVTVPPPCPRGPSRYRRPSAMPSAFDEGRRR